MKRFANPVPQFLLYNGDLATAGKFYFYENGSTTVPKSTYSDSSGGVTNTNPVVLSGEGRIPPVFGEGLYTVVFKDKNDVQQWVRHDVEFSGEEGQFADYSTVINYPVNAIVRYNGNYWISDVPNNLGSAPVSPSARWTQINFIEYFNSQKNGGYSLNDIVSRNGLLYRSAANANTTTPPGASWDNLTFNDSTPGDFTVGGNLIANGATIAGTIACASLTATGAINANNITVNGLTAAGKQSVRVDLGGGFDANQYVVLEKIGSTVTITSSNFITHPSSTSAVSAAVIPSQYRLGANYSPSGNISVLYRNNTGFDEIQIRYDGTIALLHFDSLLSATAKTSTFIGFCVSYTVTSETP